MTELALKIEGLSKSYRLPFKFKKFKALESLDLELEKGQILGFLGPNGAGKTTTFKIMLGLVHPDKGRVLLNGKPCQKHQNRSKIGFLPENPYFYPHLTAKEFLDFYARLFGLDMQQRKSRIEELLKIVGLEHAADRQLRKFSRGMLQRIGIAQALVNDPELLILDEPMSGLDPMGRKEMRDIIIQCRTKGKSVIFSSHILSDVEMICDKVAILIQGKLREVVHVNDILNRDIRAWEIAVQGITPDISSIIETKGFETIFSQNRTLIKIKDETDARSLLNEIQKQQGMLISFNPKRDNLEDIFVKKTEEGRAA